MKKLILILALTLPMFGQCAKQLVFAGPGFSGSEVAAVAAIANRLACPGEDVAKPGSGIGIWSLTGGAWTPKGYAIYQGAMVGVPGIPLELRRYVDAAAIVDAGMVQQLVANGVPTQSEVTRAAVSGGGIVTLHLLPAKWKSAITFAARVPTGQPPQWTFGVTRRLGD